MTSSWATDHCEICEAKVFGVLCSNILLTEGLVMVATAKDYAELALSNADCLRPIGGNCTGNCRKTGKNVQLEW